MLAFLMNWRKPLAAVGGVLATLVGRWMTRRDARRTARKEAEIAGWRQADEAERQRAADDADRDVDDARERLRDLAERHGPKPGD